MSEFDSNATQENHADLPPRDESKLEELPQRIGRYRVEKIIGQGGFGLVYLAKDESLDRAVAVKVPHARLVSRPEDAELYLAEARTVASLEHPHIVPVHDVGSMAEFPCFVVSRYVPGCDLATHLKQTRLSYAEAADLVATVAEALHYAHKRGIVHRDVKPGNILIDKDGKPFIVDFGLALREESIGKGARHVGTPAYMSPEQARGEGHRVDGRSDIFSLGVLFYEILAGRRPFRADTQAEMFDQIQTLEPRPLSQYDERIPKELQRICLKALSKRASDRFSSAHEMAEDLRHFLNSPESLSAASNPKQNLGTAETAVPATPTHVDSAKSTKPGFDSDQPISDSPIIKIVPKGLRSFDAHDADFFLELLPGARDRNGLPDSLRFWKTRIEETDPDSTFSVGLIYGPSGCGKSSLVKAGLLPRLSPDVIAIYIEATSDETELRLLSGLRKRCPLLEERWSLTESLAALRRGQTLPPGKKVLIVIDQFEQWLHAKRDQEHTDLVAAIRQCDGIHVQCIVMVRDDFWMAATRFMRDLDIRLVEGQNSAAVDLFPIRHAEKVLSAFGRAFGALPSETKSLSKEQTTFLSQAVACLAEEGKVVCVRLALFAQMLRGKPWTRAALNEVGGTTGVGVTFLEETFSAKTAPPEHRYHQKAARAVLKELIPNSGADIRGTMKSYAELLETSGYGNRPKDFDDLIRILDGEIRLITPADPVGKEIEDDLVDQQKPSGQKYFQLTHDYLVHSLRDWLSRKLKETRSGRSQLQLFDASVMWNSKPQNRYLPSILEWISIRTLTKKSKWTTPQRKMMAKANRYYGFRLGLVAILLVTLFGNVIYQIAIAKASEAERIEILVANLFHAAPIQVPYIKAQLMDNSGLASKSLARLLSFTPKNQEEKRAQLYARMILIDQDATQVEPLVEELFACDIEFVGPILQVLKPRFDQLRETFHLILDDPTAESQKRLRAALALANYNTSLNDETWSESNLRFVAEQLVSYNSEDQPLLRQLLLPIKNLILKEIEVVFENSNASELQHIGAANAIRDYLEGDVVKLTPFLASATPQQFDVLYPSISWNPDAESSISVLSPIVSALPSEDLDSISRISYGQRRANVAVTMLRLGERDKVLPLFDWIDDPEAVTQFFFRCKPRGVTVNALLDLLDIVISSPSEKYFNDARQAVLFAIGEYNSSEIPEDRRQTLVKYLGEWYANDPNSGVHGASGWLLRHLGEKEIVDRVDQTPVPYSPDREWFTLAIKAQLKLTNDSTKTDSETSGKNPGKPDETPTLPPTKTFYYTFIVFPPGEYNIGAVKDQPDRVKDQVRHTVKLTRPFALLDREITFEELIAFKPFYAGFMGQFVANSTDAGFGADWYDSVAFCRWLGAQTGLSEPDQCYADPSVLDVERYPRESSPGANWAPRDWPLNLDGLGFRLPTEAEWEVAARGGTRTTYGFGSDQILLQRFGWFAENSGRHAHPPKELRPSVRGLFDLHGNLSEWTHDWYDDFGTLTQADPLGAQGGSRRVYRGGGWSDEAVYCQSSFRGADNPSYRLSNLGFRLALSLSSRVAASPEKEDDAGGEEADR